MKGDLPALISISFPIFCRPSLLQNTSIAVKTLSGRGFILLADIRMARLVVNFCLHLSVYLPPSPSLSLSLSVTYSTISCVSSSHIGCFDLAHHPTLSCHAQRMLYPHKYIMSISIELVGLMKYIAEPVGEYIVRTTVF